MEINSMKRNLPHHEQQALCTTRLPYRQGKKLTAVKVYTVNNESKHLLIFGVPSLNLRQEVKAQLGKFGKVQQLTISMNHEAEVFTETFHVVFEKIQSARIAKKMLDTKSFYGGVLHICYAPEFENLDDTRQKLELRRRDIFLRLRNLDREKSQKNIEKPQAEVTTISSVHKGKLDMGEVNLITSREVTIAECLPQDSANRSWSVINVFHCNRSKRKLPIDNKVILEKQFKPCFETKVDNKQHINVTIPEKDNVDLTSAEKKIVSNSDADKTLNCNTFGKELIKKLPPKPVNVIKFHNKKTL